MKVPNKFITLSILFLAINISLAHSEEIKKQLYFMGGGDEPISNSSTQFDLRAERLGKFVSSSKWKTTISFNGGHTDTERIIKENFSNAKNLGTFWESKYQKIVKDIYSKIDTGELKKNDQLMIIINSHGNKKKDEEITHTIGFSHRRPETGEELAESRSKPDENFTLDELEKIATIAAEKGIKLAIIDASCYSGNLLNIKNKNICMISTTGPDQVAYSINSKLGIFDSQKPFNNKFFESFKSGENLENIFLNARKGGPPLPDFPMISTEEGRALNELLYKFISPYLYDKVTKPVLYYTGKESIFRSQVCSEEKHFQETINFLQNQTEFTKIADALIAKELASLKNALIAHRNYRKEIEEIINKKFNMLNEELKNIINNLSPEDKTIIEDWKLSSKSIIDYITLDWNVNEYSTLLNIWSKENPTEANITENKKRLKEYTRKSELALSIKNQLSPSSQAVLNKFNLIVNDDTKLSELSNKVSVEAKKVYSTLYEKLKNKDQSNPCKDFIL